MSVPRMRPTFDLRVSRDAVDTLARLRAHLTRVGDRIEHRAAGDHLTVTIPGPQRHFWSPWLWIEVTPEEPGSTRVFGRFSPHPSVWTGVMLCQLALLTIAAFGAMFAAAQATMGRPATALWVAIIALAASGLVYAMSLVGQRLALDQMHELHVEIEAALGVDPRTDD